MENFFKNLVLYQPYQQVHYNGTQCIRRQWNPNNTVPVYESLEFINSVMQIPALPGFIPPALNVFRRYATSQDAEIALESYFNNTIYQKIQIYPFFEILNFLYAHFKPHLYIGGDKGDLSVPLAPDDVIFWLFHSFIDNVGYRFQLSHDELLVPITYNLGVRLIDETQDIVISNIDSDNLTYYTDIPVKETFQMGFGDLCFIPDFLIRPINQLLNNKTPTEPLAIQRLKTELPLPILLRYFPYFATNQYSFFSYYFEDVGNCNPKPQINLTNPLFCRTIPVALKFNDTSQGRRQLYAFQTAANFDVTPFVYPAEDFYYNFLYDINPFYCSPYA